MSSLTPPVEAREITAKPRVQLGPLASPGAELAVVETCHLETRTLVRRVVASALSSSDVVGSSNMHGTEHGTQKRNTEAASHGSTMYSASRMCWLSSA